MFLPPRPYSSEDFGHDIISVDTKQHTTSFLLAAAKGNNDIVALLLCYGANQLSVDDEGNNALMLTVAVARSEECTIVLLQSLAQSSSATVR